MSYQAATVPFKRDHDDVVHEMSDPWSIRRTLCRDAYKINADWENLEQRWEYPTCLFCISASMKTGSFTR